MRPNFALGPIDSIAQYLLYVSIVVLGVVLPLLVQKWRQRRERSRLLAHTIRALRNELSANRERLLVSRGTFEVLGNALNGDYEHYLRLWQGLRDAVDPPLEPSPPQAEDRLITLASLSRTAWEVAQLSNALPTIAPDQLRELTRAYVLQTVFEDSRGLLLEYTFRAEALDAPIDLRDLRAVESRLGLLAVYRAVVRHQAALLTALVAAYDSALAATEDG